MLSRHAQATYNIDARVGEPFNIVLEGNATTPYRWRLDLGRDKLRLMNEQYFGGGDAVGSGGTYVFTIEPVAPGKATIRARYSGGGGGDEHTSKQHEFYIDIRD